MFSEFANIIEHRHEAAKAWKEKTGKPAMGYLCCVFPEEVLFAAGILPVRIVGSDEPIEKVDGHITPYGCTFCRKCVDLARTRGLRLPGCGVHLEHLRSRQQHGLLVE